MSEKRKLIRMVNKYVALTFWHTEIAKENASEYLLEAKLLQAIINSYIDQTLKEFQSWCDKSVEAWNMSQDNIILSAKRFIKMHYINSHLDKLSGELEVAGILKSNMQIVQERLTQFDQLLPSYKRA